MLIRSQDKRMIVNFENVCTVSAFSEKDSEDIYIEDGAGSLMVGRYSTKEKSMKVLDMIQEVYCEFMSVKNDDAWDGKESVFYMPVDGEVVV